MGFLLEQLQTQSLVLTPELIQSIKILQCSSMELNELIQDELLSNPMLELDENQPEPSIAKELNNKFDWTEHAKERSYDDLASRKIITVSESEDYNYEQFVKAEITLSEYLHTQLSLIHIKPDICSIANYIIDTLNSSGYRTERATEIATKFSLTHEQVLEAIAVVQSLEPAGIAAKSIPECLQLQLERKGLYNKTYEKILFEHLDDLASNKMNVIAKDINASLEDTIHYCNEIKRLNPKPGNKYGKFDGNKYIVPDLEIKEFNGEYLVLQNTGIIPLINCSPYYDRLLREAAGDKEATDYLHKKMNAALLLVKSIDQRKTIIQNVAEEIVNRQKAFMQKGVSALKPMTQKELAETLHVHESTISRAVNGKYIQTPQGVFELRYFFSTKISNVTGADQSAEAVKNQIKNIVAKENPKTPYSDEKIKSLLFSNYGTDIARRTVAKYREQLGILGTYKRKKY